MISVEECVAEASRMADARSRSVLGLAGAPGSGKSTLAARLVEALGVGPDGTPRAVVVPMDGFHLAQAELERLGRAKRKGAIDTFDGHGFAALLARLRAAEEDVTYAPAFDRSLEEPIAGAVAVPRAVPLVIVEGNYLLAEELPWEDIRPMLDLAWYVEVPEVVRLERLVARHVAHGRSAEDARGYALGSDQVNAELIATTRYRADAVVDLS